MQIINNNFSPIDFDKLDSSFSGIWKQLDVYSSANGYLGTQRKGLILRDAYSEKKVRKGCQLRILTPSLAGSSQHSQRTSVQTRGAA